MPILPSDVDGVEPHDLGRGDRARLRELCEVLLTTRAKMLGLSKSFAHRLSSLPPDLKHSLVNGFGEIIAHLDSFQIQLGDTKLTGKVKLGADEGMDAHFPDGPIVHVEARGSYRGSSTIESTPMPAARRAPPQLPAKSGEAPARKRRGHAGLVQERREGRIEQQAELERKGRRAAEGSRQWMEETGLVAPAPPSSDEAEEDATYGHLYRQVQQRRAHQLDRHALSRREHGMLCWVVLGILVGDPERPEGSYEERESALAELERKRYVRREGRKWLPTPSGLEASGLIGMARLELDP